MYKDKRTGEIYFSREKVDDPDLEYLGEVEEKAFGRGRAVSAAHPGGSEAKKEGNAARDSRGAVSGG